MPHPARAQWAQRGQGVETLADVLDAAGRGAGVFHNVFLQPWAYREFTRAGELPDGAMLVLTFYQASRKVTPARGGFYEGEQSPGFEVHLKKAAGDGAQGPAGRPVLRLPRPGGCARQRVCPVLFAPPAAGGGCPLIGSSAPTPETRP